MRDANLHVLHGRRSELCGHRVVAGAEGHERVNQAQLAHARRLHDTAAEVHARAGRASRQVRIGRAKQGERTVEAAQQTHTPPAALVRAAIGHKIGQHHQRRLLRAGRRAGVQEAAHLLEAARRAADQLVHLHDRLVAGVLGGEHRGEAGQCSLALVGAASTHEAKASERRRRARRRQGRHGCTPALLRQRCDDLAGDTSSQ